MKYFNKVNDFDTFEKLWKDTHEYKYYSYKSITNERYKELIEENYEKDFKRYDLYLINDNKFIVFDKKITINKNFYYDDEMEAPTNTFKNFVFENECNFKYEKIKFNESEKPFLIQRYCTDEKEVNIISNDYDYDSDLNYYKKTNYFVRFLTKEETEEYNQLVDFYKNIYDERLEKYFKKYSKKINYIGYWRDR